MNRYEYFHEKEVVELKLYAPPLPNKILHDFLISMGFVYEDNFYYLDRTDKTEPWQAVSILTIDKSLKCKNIKTNTNELIEGYWDCLSLSYFLASLPANFIEDFINNVFILSGKFDLKVIHRNKEISNKSELEFIFRSYVNELIKDYGEPGSEELAIMIQYTYPR